MLSFAVFGEFVEEVVVHGWFAEWIAPDYGYPVAHFEGQSSRAGPVDEELVIRIEDAHVRNGSVLGCKALDDFSVGEILQREDIAAGGVFP